MKKFNEFVNAQNAAKATNESTLNESTGAGELYRGEIPNAKTFAIKYYDDEEELVLFTLNSAKDYFDFHQMDIDIWEESGFVKAIDDAEVGDVIDDSDYLDIDQIGFNSTWVRIN